MKQWAFPSAEHIGIKGFNDIGEEFKDNPMYNLAKEICQNSLDTKVTEEFENNGQPIMVEFKEFWIKPNEIPGNEKNEFKKVFEEELKYSEEYYENDKTVPDFYKNALNILNSTSIRCLRISDSNTTGLLGSDKEIHSPWSNLTKNSGVTDKPEGSAGSKGKGKFASFICSELYTVFYSTKSNDGLDASCGISRLSGYKKSDETITIGEGYYEDDNKPLKYCLNLDKNYIRTTYGTDIYIIGFKNSENWKEKMCSAIIENFFVAIYKGDLVINIGEDFEISKNTIGELISNKSISDFLLLDTDCYYKILVAGDDEILSKSYSMFENDDIELLLRKDDIDINDVNKVATVRLTGMKILDLNRLPRLGKYHGILFMKGLKVNDYFRKLENATHNNWSADRVQNSSEAKDKIKELKNFVTKSIYDLMAGNILDEVDATGVGETLPDEDEISDSNDNALNESVENEVVKTIEIKEIPIKKLKKNEQKTNGDDIDSPALEPDEDGDINKTGEHSGHNTPPNPNPIPSKEYKYSEVNKRLIPSKLRLTANLERYELTLEVNRDEKILKIDVEIYGESSNEKVKFKNVKCFTENVLIKHNIATETNQNSIILKNLKKENSYKIQFAIDSDGIWPLEVKIYGEE